MTLRKDGEGATVDQVKADIARGEGLVQDARESHGLSRNCA